MDNRTKFPALNIVPAPTFGINKSGLEATQKAPPPMREKFDFKSVFESSVVQEFLAARVIPEFKNEEFSRLHDACSVSARAAEMEDDEYYEDMHFLHACINACEKKSEVKEVVRGYFTELIERFPQKETAIREAADGHDRRLFIGLPSK